MTKDSRIKEVLSLRTTVSTNSNSSGETHQKICHMHLKGLDMFHSKGHRKDLHGSFKKPMNKPKINPAL